MNFKKTISRFIIICLLFAFTKADAQFNIGAQGTIGAFSGGVGFLKGGGIEAGYGLLPLKRHKDSGSKLFVCGSFNYYTGGSGSGYYEAYAFSNMTTDYYIDVPYTYSLRLMQVNVGAKYFVAGGMSAPFSFYAQLGLSAVILPVKYDVATYDRTQYDNYNEPESRTYFGAGFHAGIGIDVKAGPVHIYLATRLLVPANQVNGEYIEVVIPFGAMADAGIRIPIGEKK